MGKNLSLAERAVALGVLKSQRTTNCHYRRPDWSCGLEDMAREVIQLGDGDVESDAQAAGLNLCRRALAPGAINMLGTDGKCQAKRYQECQFGVPADE